MTNLRRSPGNSKGFTYFFLPLYLDMDFPVDKRQGSSNMPTAPKEWKLGTCSWPKWPTTDGLAECGEQVITVDKVPEWSESLLGLSVGGLAERGLVVCGLAICSLAICSLATSRFKVEIWLERVSIEEVECLKGESFPRGVCVSPCPGVSNLPSGFQAKRDG
jgi:hypothetical protein